MKKTFVTIKDIQWYEENKDEHGIVYLDPVNDSDFFSRGQSEFLGRLSEVTAVDKSNNYKLQIDKNEYIWKEWQFSSIEEKEINNDGIIDVTYEDHEIISEDKEIHNYIKESLQIEDKRSTVQFKADLIHDINEWGLGFNIGTCLINLISLNKNDLTSYKNLLEICRICIDNELKEMEK